MDIIFFNLYPHLINTYRYSHVYQFFMIPYDYLIMKSFFYEFAYLSYTWLSCLYINFLFIMWNKLIMKILLKQNESRKKKSPYCLGSNWRAMNANKALSKHSMDIYIYIRWPRLAYTVNRRWGLTCSLDKRTRASKRLIR